MSLESEVPAEQARPQLDTDAEIALLIAKAKALYEEIAEGTEIVEGKVTPAYEPRLRISVLTGYRQAVGLLVQRAGRINDGKSHAPDTPKGVGLPENLIDAYLGRTTP